MTHRPSKTMDKIRASKSAGGSADKSGVIRNKVIPHTSPTAKKANSSGGSRQSKVNRILNNIERSIMRPFSTSSSNIHEQTTSVTNKSVLNSSPKHINNSEGSSNAECSKEMRDSNGCDSSSKHNQKPNRMTNKGSINGIRTTHSENKGGLSGELQQSLDKREQQQKVPRDQVANNTEYYMHHQGRNRRNDTTASIVDNSVDFGGHVNGKLDAHQMITSSGKGPAPSVPPKAASHTFNKFQQHLVSTLRHHNAHSNNNNNTKVLPTISNKLSIPPPHANEEARSHNQSMLFGRNAADAVTSLSISQQQQNESPAKTNSATSRLTATSSTARQQQQVSSTKPVSHNSNSCASHRTSSPASAKSLPSIVTRLGSQLNGGLKKKSAKNADSDLISKTEDEESGFSNYQSRRPPLRSVVTSQSTNDTNINSTNKTSSNTQHSETTTLSTATNTTATTHMMPTHQSYWQSPNCVNSYNSASQQPFSYHQPQQQQQQYPAINGQLFHNPHSFMPIKQVPSAVMSLVRKNLNGVQYNLQHQQQDQQQARVNYLNSMRQHQQQNQPFPNTEQQSIYGIHNVPTPQQVKQSYMLPGNADNSQQIYANAPPKPRRYQFYGNVLDNPNYSPQLARTTTAPGMMCANRSGAPTRQHPHQPIRPFDQVSTGVRSNNCDQLSLNSMPSNLKVSNLDHNRIINVGPLDCRPMSYGSHLSPNIYYERNSLQQDQQHFIGAPLSKSKSSLESEDLIRLRHNRLMRPTQVARPQAWHPMQQQQGNMFAGPSSEYRQHDLASLSGIRPDPSASNGVNLQRSKSVTHLLPDFEYQQAQMNSRAREMWQDSRQVANNLRYLSTSSASTTNLNNAADMNCYPNHNVQYVLNSDRNNLNKALSSYHLNDLNQFYDSTHATQLQQKYQQIYPGGLFPNATIRRAATNDWLLKQQQHLIKQNEINFTNAMPTASDKAVPSSTTSSNNNSGMFVRQQQQLQAPMTEDITPTDDSSKPSLDDKIRHLVIANDNKDSAGGARLINQHVGVNCSAFNQANECSDNNSIKTGCQSSRQVSTTKGHNPNLQRHDLPINVGQSSLVESSSNLSSQQIDKALSDSSSIYNTIKASGLQTNLGEGTSPANDNSISNLVMGNRHNRLYQVNVPASMARGDNTANGEVANSQLIVDLTTPRVLAKTQTTLSSNQSNFSNTNNQLGNDNQSINQVGLPQSFNNPQKTADNNNASSSKLDANLNSRLQVDRSKDTPANKTNLFERTAPYYYSDLKSDEQRQALLNIVQQKSLSPPPQLLSRSADQSSTRLGPKSATLHSKQAKLLSENLTNKQQRPSIQNQPDFSSNSNITKNIDRLFEVSKSDNMARSMLTLNNNGAGAYKGSQQQTLQKVPSPPQMTSVSLDKKPTKSKSLDNINQALDQIKSSKDSHNVSNPVYENIRLSSKLMNAISSSGGQPVTSDESMDSILSSSLEDSDSNSDIIDDIKLSPTDNHINDISRLIEQLKINHSKLTDEYRSTLIRITKTINSKNKQSNCVGQKMDSDKIARKLDLLKSKSKKCESRSKNQLALIQMMENVLRQSKLRAESVNKYQSGSWSNDSATSENNKNSTAFNISKTIDALSDSLPIDKSDNSGGKSSASSLTPNSKASDADKPSKDQDNKKPKQHEDSSDICKIGSFDSLRKDKLVTSSVAEKILDIEKRTRDLPGGSPTEEKVPVPSDKRATKSPIRDNSNAADSPSNISGSSNANNSLNSITNGFQTLRDDDDFIEFYSSDISGHRSNFEASQFSASDYNTSTSASESSTSGLCTDSLGSTKNMHNFQFAGKKCMRSDNIYSDSKSDGDSKLRSHSNLRAMHDKNPNTPNTNGRHSADLDSIRSGKFTNVLGNVIDVDVCPVNNPSRCSPLEN